MQETERERQPVKSANAIVDASKLTAPQRKILQLATEQGVPMARKLEEVHPGFELTEDESEQFDKTLKKLRADSRKESANPFK